MVDRISKINWNHEQNRVKNESNPLIEKKGSSSSYSSKKAPGFEKMLNYWFPGHVTPQMVTTFQQNMSQALSNEIHREEARHKKVQEEIKRRIKEND